MRISYTQFININNIIMNPLRSVSFKVTTFYKFFIVIMISGLSSIALLAQDDSDAFFIKSIYGHALASSQSYSYLEGLCATAGPRLTGTQASYDGLEYCERIIKEIGVDTMWRAYCDVPRWHRGNLEISLSVNGEEIPVRATALGNTEGTSGDQITGELVELMHLDSLPSTDVNGKIAFFNRPMDPTQIVTYRAYGGAVDQRALGASRAAKHGAIASIVRSIGSPIDTFPHTGSSIYEEDTPRKIPGIAVSTHDAEVIGSALAEGSSVTATFSSTSTMLPDTTSYSIVAEIRGNEHPDEIILVGGHIDSWDLGEGAHDDGTGCMQSIQVIETLKALGYQPKRTIRCVLFTNEENGLAGGKSYAKEAIQNGEYHLAAIESDGGGFSPRGFSCAGHADIFIPMLKNLKSFESILEPYDLYIKNGSAGADITPLKPQKGLLISLNVDSQRYFDLHHTSQDVIENVHPREFILGGAAMTSLVYLIDQYGL